MPSPLRLAAIAAVMAALAALSMGVRGQAVSPRQSDDRQRPLFRAATDLVALHVTVNDEKGGAMVGPDGARLQSVRGRCRTASPALQ